MGLSTLVPCRVAQGDGKENVQAMDQVSSSEGAQRRALVCKALAQKAFQLVPGLSSHQRPAAVQALSTLSSCLCQCRGWRGRAERGAALSSLALMVSIK
jgi:hypothetical protein